MPAGLDGIETALRVRRVWSSAKLPIIILSASGDRGNIEMGLNNLRCNDFVKKARPPPEITLSRSSPRHHRHLALPRDPLFPSSTLLLPAPTPIPLQPVTQQELVARVAAQIRMREALKMEADSAVLRTMLPPHILSRISRGERDIAEAHRNVTCLFSGARAVRRPACLANSRTLISSELWRNTPAFSCADVVGFTELCSRVPTLKVVRALNEMFTSFGASIHFQSTAA